MIYKIAKKDNKMYINEKKFYVYHFRAGTKIGDHSTHWAMKNVKFWLSKTGEPATITDITYPNGDNDKTICAFKLNGTITGKAIMKYKSLYSDSALNSYTTQNLFNNPTPGQNGCIIDGLYTENPQWGIYFVFETPVRLYKMSSMGHSTNYIFGEYEILASSDKPVDDNVLDLTYKLVGKGTNTLLSGLDFEMDIGVVLWNS